MDVKGRLAIPAWYRERLQSCCDSRLVITVDRDRCLLIYPKPTWIEIERKLDQLPSFNEQARMLQRLYIGHAQDSRYGRSGTGVVTTALDKRAALVDQGKKFELRDEETWNGNCGDWLNQADLSQVESGPGIASLNIWLPVASRRLPAELFFCRKWTRNCGVLLVL